MPKLSIIVPVYNVERYVGKCLDSLVNQTFQDIEIIVINDGSTDSSSKKIENYRQQYPDKIQYYQKENEGIAEARNYGVRQAKGEYIAFVDSDDYVAENLFSDIAVYMEKGQDMIKYKTIEVDENEVELQKIAGPVFQDLTGEEAFEQLWKQDVLIDAAWLYVYRKAFFLENQFHYEKGRLHEDFGLTPMILIQALHVTSIELYGYYYRQTKGSIMREQQYEKIIKRCEDALFHYDNMVQAVEKMHIHKHTREDIKIYYTNSILLKAQELKKKEQKQYCKQIRKRKMLQNIKVRNLKQLLKRVLLTINIGWYLKLR